MQHAAEQAVSVLRMWAEETFPGSLVPMGILDHSETQWGFGIAHDGGLTLVLADVTGTPSNAWVVQLSGGLAIHVPDATGSLVWANDRNRRIAHGKCYCAIAEAQDLAAIVYENTLAGAWFEAFLDGPHGPGTFRTIGGQLRGMLQLQVTSTAEYGEGIRKVYGGQPFEPSEQGLLNLLTVAGG